MPTNLAVVTTVYKPAPEMIVEAATLAKTLDVPLIDRNSNSLDAIRAQCAVDSILVVTKAGPVVHTPGGEYFFHLSMADLRIINLRNGKDDHMIMAMDLAPGDAVLDCTLGLGTDAIVASFVAGTAGTVFGLEASPIIATITGIGLQRFRAEQPDVTAALRRIQVENVDYAAKLPQLPSRSFDVVYFDPMFRSPIRTSSNLKPVRFLADGRPVEPAAIREACRIAKKRVVLKEANGSREFNRLGFPIRVGGKYSSVQYGVNEVGG